MKGKVIGLVVILIIVGIAINTYFHTPKEPEVYKIGAILPLTGDISEYGQRIKRGIEIALEEVNQLGQRRVEVIYEDSKGSSREGVTVAHKLINKKVCFIIGAVSSSVTLSIIPISDQYKVLLFSPASSSPKLSGISSYFVRNWPSDVLEATVLAEYAYERLNIRKAVIFYVNNDYGLGLKEEFSKTFRKKGGEILGIEAYPLNARDFRSLVGKYRNRFEDIEAIYLAGYHRDMAFATKQLREGGYKGLTLADADYGIPEVIEIAGEAAEGNIYASPWYNPEANETAKKFARIFKQRYKTFPSEFEGNGYDALKLIVEGIQKHGCDPIKVAQHIKQIKHYPGAGGYLTFTPKGDVIKPIAIMKVEKGEFKRMEVFEPVLDEGGNE